MTKKFFDNLRPQLLSPVVVSDPAEELANIERRIGIRLPPLYAFLLLEYQAPIIFEEDVEFIPMQRSPWDGEDGLQSLEIVFGLGKDVYSVSHMLDRYRDRMPDGVIPIGEAPFGNIIVLGTKGDVAGKVFFWDHEDEREITGDKQLDYGNMYLIAESLENFLNRLQPGDDDDV